MGRRRQIHHAQSVSAKLVSDENYAACAPNEALDWPEGSYSIVRLPQATFRDKTDAETEALRRFPGAQIGKCMPVRGKWIVRIRTKEMIDAFRAPPRG